MSKSDKLVDNINLILQKHSEESTYKRVVGEALEVFGDRLSMALLLKIIDHLYLAHYVLKSKSKKYFSITEALCDNDIRSERTIAVFIEELDLYLLFDNINDTESLFDSLSYLKHEVKISSYQLVPINIRQKIVFSISGSDENKEIIKQHTKTHFNSDIYCVKNGEYDEITVIADLVKNYKESKKLIDEFCSVVSKIDQNLAKNIIKLHEMDEKGIRYTSSLINLMKELDPVDILGYTSFTRDLVRNYDFPFPVVKRNTDENIKSEKEMFALNWIRRNPPSDKEKKAEYFEKFQTSTNRKIQQGIFNGIVKEEHGVEDIRINDIRCWIYP